MSGEGQRQRERNWLISWSFLSLLLIGYFIYSQSSEPMAWIEPMFILNVIVLTFLYGFHLRADRWMLTFGVVITYNLFVHDGIIAEWVAHVCALLIVMVIQRKWSLRLLTRWLNGSIFCSASAATAYWLVSFADKEAIDLIYPGISNYLDDTAYLLTYIVFLYGMRSIDVYYQQDWNEQVFFPNWKWETFTLFLLPPFSMLMQTFAADGDQLAIIYLMVPLLALSYIFYLYAKMEDMHLQLTTIHELSHAFSAELKMDKALAAFYEGLKRIFPFQAVYIYELGEDRQTMLPVHAERFDEVLVGELNAFRMNEPLVYPFTRKMLANMKDLFGNQIPAHENISIFPMAWNRVVRGFIVIAHAKAVVLKGRKRVLAEILIRQMTVALHNARRYEMTKQRSREDELTGLINQRHFESRLFQELAFAQQQETSFAVLLMDIDFFKRVNDTYGHLAGNAVLKQLSTILKDSIGPEDVVARYGGEEFAIIIRYADARRAGFIAEQIRMRIQDFPFEIQPELDDETIRNEQLIAEAHELLAQRDPQLSENMETKQTAVDQHQTQAGSQLGSTMTIQVTVSIGISIYPEHAEDAHGLIRLADRAMYVGAKQAGRNRAALYRK